MAKTTTATLQKMKNNGEKIAMITAYDASFAQLFEQQGADIILVGDSLGMVVQGQTDTVPVTNAEVAYHTRCVRAGASKPLLIADMPFMTYATADDAMKNAAQLMQAGAEMVKVEGGDWLVDTVRTLTERGIAVCAHLGLTPQSVRKLGGFKMQGKQAKEAKQMIADAKALEDAGAQLLVLECVPAELAKEITQSIRIPTIGIGAGRDTDGQVLVMHDIFGISTGYIPRFSKNFLNETGRMDTAIAKYVQDVKMNKFPTDEHILA